VGLGGRECFHQKSPVARFNFGKIIGRAVGERSVSRVWTRERVPLVPRVGHGKKGDLPENVLGALKNNKGQDNTWKEVVHFLGSLPRKR
jgi:hypothetical protein